MPPLAVFSHVTLLRAAITPPTPMSSWLREGFYILPHILHFTTNFTFYHKFYILQQILHFTTNFTFYHKFYILPQILHFAANFTFYHKFYILPQILHFTANFTFYHKFYILPQIFSSSPRRKSRDSTWIRGSPLPPKSFPTQQSPFNLACTLCLLTPLGRYRKSVGLMPKYMSFSSREKRKTDCK